MRNSDVPYETQLLYSTWMKQDYTGFKDTILLIHRLTVVIMLFVIADNCNNNAIRNIHSKNERYLQLIDQN